MSDEGRPDADKTVGQIMDEVITMAADLSDRGKFALERVIGAISAEKPPPPTLDDSHRSKALLARFELQWLKSVIDRFERSV